MLVITRRLGEKVLIGNDVRVTVTDIDRGRIRLGIEAPQTKRVWREEAAPEGFETIWGTIKPNEDRDGDLDVMQEGATRR